jgi:hypothetical protein
MERTSRHVSAVILVFGLVACGGSDGTSPHDMSARSHDERAAGDERASTHEEEPCGVGGGAARQVDVPCWTALDPAVVEQHRTAAAAHRAAAATLRDAEAQACVGIEAADRDISPFEHRADIVSVTPITEPVGGGASAPQVVGARVVFRAVAGMTPQWLQREVDCHLARNAALGHDVPEMDDCPLVPRGASAQVMPVSDGLAVEIRGDDASSIRQIVDRANGLLGP